jgi:hypothetical protein
MTPSIVGGEKDAFFDLAVEQTQLDIVGVGGVDREVVQGVQYQGVQGSRPRFW